MPTVIAPPIRPWPASQRCVWREWSAPRRGTGARAHGPSTGRRSGAPRRRRRSLRGRCRLQGRGGIDGREGKCAPGVTPPRSAVGDRARSIAGGARASTAPGSPRPVAAAHGTRRSGGCAQSACEIISGAALHREAGGRHVVAGGSAALADRAVDVEAPRRLGVGDAGGCRAFWASHRPRSARRRRAASMVRGTRPVGHDRPAPARIIGGGRGRHPALLEDGGAIARAPRLPPPTQAPGQPRSRRPTV